MVPELWVFHDFLNLFQLIVSGITSVSSSLPPAAIDNMVENGMTRTSSILTANSQNSGVSGKTMQTV